ncbi:copper resistance CopC family protein [Phytohabitans sp. LJ34]|uniref:copper resistance CopC family protein n=1 Tax=Phytohabitans sp. LJ34 TaxID=3452217 RepID=UPI003F8B616B
MLRRASALLVLTLGVAVFGLPPAGAAQGGLTASTPAAQAALAAAPAAVELTFSAVPAAADSHVAVVDESGAKVDTGELALVAAGTLRRPVSIGAAGDYTVAYHVEFEGGGEAKGILRFSVGTGAPPPASDRAVEVATAAVSDTHGHGVDPIGATLLVIDGLVVLVVVGLLYLRRPVRLPPA